jgi:hypothetical protein
MDSDKRYLVYDPKGRKWLADGYPGAHLWTTEHRQAREFPNYQAANMVRCEIQNDGECGNHELYVTERHSA